MNTPESHTPPADSPDGRIEWLQFLDGTLPGEKVARLNSQLQSDAKLRIEFAELLLLQVQLGEIGRELTSTVPGADPNPSRQIPIAAEVAGDRAVPRSVVEASGPHPRKRKDLPLTKDRIQQTVLRWSIALAASLAFLLGLSIWLFGARMGEPVLAEVQNEVILTRGIESFTAQAGTRLSPGDLLHIGTNGTAAITFGPEATIFNLHPTSELKITSLRKGKQFTLNTGKIEATVARQRPLNPMIIATPDAEARVLGTKFTLTAAPNRTRLDVDEGEVRLTRTADDAHADVPGGYYAIASQDTELVALAMTGAISLEWWIGVSGKSLNDLSNDPRFPDRPDGRGTSRAFELKPVATNQFAVRFRGYVHPPITGDYEFWLAAGHDGTLHLSGGERAEDKGRIAIALGPGKPRFWDGPRFNGASQWAPPVPLIAGTRYYIEAIAFIEKGDAHLSVAWKRPNAPRELLMGDFLSPVEPGK